MYRVVYCTTDKVLPNNDINGGPFLIQFNNIAYLKLQNIMTQY